MSVKRFLPPDFTRTPSARVRALNNRQKQRQVAHPTHASHAVIRFVLSGLLMQRKSVVKRLSHVSLSVFATWNSCLPMVRRQTSVTPTSTTEF